jgi:hypothetical protein
MTLVIALPYVLCLALLWALLAYQPTLAQQAVEGQLRADVALEKGKVSAQGTLIAQMRQPTPRPYQRVP